MSESRKTPEMERHSVLMEAGVWEKLISEGKEPGNQRQAGNQAGVILKNHFEKKEARENGKEKSEILAE